MLVTLSYPEFDARGDRNLPSLYLEDLLLAPQDSRPCGRAPRRSPRGPRLAASSGVRRGLPRLPAPEDREGLSHRLETYLQCPFQYLRAAHPAPRPRRARPEERLDFLTQGNIVHEVLAELVGAAAGRDRPLRTELSRAASNEKRIPRGYHTERLRNAMLDDLRAFAAGDAWPRGDFQSRTERIRVPARRRARNLAAGSTASMSPPMAAPYVIDYKYSAAAARQGQAEGREPVAGSALPAGGRQALRSETFRHVLRGREGRNRVRRLGRASFHGRPPLPGELARSRPRADAASGRGDPLRPRGCGARRLDNCRYCDSRDMCRVDRRAVAPRGVAEGA